MKMRLRRELPRQKRGATALTARGHYGLVRLPFRGGYGDLRKPDCHLFDPLGAVLVDLAVQADVVALRVSLAELGHLPPQLFGGGLAGTAVCVPLAPPSVCLFPLPLFLALAGGGLFGVGRVPFPLIAEDFLCCPFGGLLLRLPGCPPPRRSTGLPPVEEILIEVLL